MIHSTLLEILKNATSQKPMRLNEIAAKAKLPEKEVWRLLDDLYGHVPSRVNRSHSFKNGEWFWEYWPTAVIKSLKGNSGALRSHVRKSLGLLPPRRNETIQTAVSASDPAQLEQTMKIKPEEIVSYVHANQGVHRYALLEHFNKTDDALKQLEACIKNGYLEQTGNSTLYIGDNEQWLAAHNLMPLSHASLTQLSASITSSPGVESNPKQTTLINKPQKLEAKTKALLVLECIEQNPGIEQFRIVHSLEEFKVSSVDGLLSGYLKASVVIKFKNEAGRPCYKLDEGVKVADFYGRLADFLNERKLTTQSAAAVAESAAVEVGNDDLHKTDADVGAKNTDDIVISETEQTNAKELANQAVDITRLASDEVQKLVFDISLDLPAEEAIRPEPQPENTDKPVLDTPIPAFLLKENQPEPTLTADRKFRLALTSDMTVILYGLGWEPIELSAIETGTLVDFVDTVMLAVPVQHRVGGSSI